MGTRDVACVGVMQVLRLHHSLQLGAILFAKILNSIFCARKSVRINQRLDKAKVPGKASKKPRQKASSTFFRLEHSVSIPHTHI